MMHPDLTLMTKSSERRLIFISHANPEDNAFAQWLALKLAQHGYLVWCDVIKLIGGEPFWANIEEAIQQHAIKVLFCGSEKSVLKKGVIREVELALKARKPEENFLVPMKVDSVAFGAFPFQISDTTNIVRFDQGWIGGLTAILKLLKRDLVPVSNPNGSEVVNAWWRIHHSVKEGVSEAEERHWSNIFPVLNKPDSIWYYPCQVEPDRPEVWKKIETPFEVHERGIFCFASPSVIEEKLSSFGCLLNKAREFSLDDLLQQGSGETPCILPHEAGKRVQSILRQAFNQKAVARGLHYYQLTNRARCYWPEKGFAPQDKIGFIGMDQKRLERQLVGYMAYGAKVDGERKRLNWHYAMQFRSYLRPFWSVVLKSHIIFTEDGKTPIESKARQHRLRRKQARNWWNDDWRDRTLAMATYLSEGKDSIRIPLSTEEEWSIPTKPQEFLANRAYQVLTRQQLEDLPDEDDDETQEDEDVIKELPAHET